MPLAQNLGFGLVRVGRVELTGGIGLVADPLRALLNLICWRKISPEWVPSFLQGLRLEPEWQSAVQSDALLHLAGRAFGKQAEMDRLVGSLQIDSRHTYELLDWTPPVSVAEGIRRMVQGA